MKPILFTLMQPRFPLYIVSKGRADTCKTTKALERMGVEYFIVIEEQECQAYAAKISPKRILILDKRYQDEYDTCDDLGTSKSKGPGAARNFAWDHSIAAGHKWHWVLDDNINAFWYLLKNQFYKVSTGSFFRIIEDFCLQYENLVIGGPIHRGFIPRRFKTAPFVLNTRVYSCNLIRNDIPYRWRGRYNEDTDLSLRALKDGYCTIQFYALSMQKHQTQKLKGGNTDAFYAHEGTLAKSQMQVQLHPDISKLVYRFNRIHHYVDYSKFKKNYLIKNPDAEPFDYTKQLTLIATTKH